MAKSIANVNILTDTTQSFVEKFNTLAFSYSTEAITANSTLSTTGSVASPVNARLFGSFAANTVNSSIFRLDGGQFVANSVGLYHGSFSANSATVNFGTAQLLANNSAGTVGQVLSSGGPGQPARWTTISGVGTVTSISGGNGLTNTTITSVGTLSVQPADASIIVTSAGVQVNAFFISALTSNASTLLTRTWAAPAPIGTTTPNTAIFTAVTANTLTIPSVCVANTSGFVVSTVVAGSASGLIPSFTARANSTNFSSISFTSSTGSTVYSTLTVNSSGTLNYNSSATFNGIGVGTNPVNGEIRATGNITSFFSSDIRLKSNVTKITNALEKVLAINGYTFTWNDDVLKSRGGEDGYFVKSKDVGVIAQEIESVLPEAVSTRADGIKAVRYELIVPLLIEAIHDLNARLKELEQ